MQIAKLQPPETDKGMQLFHSVFLIYSQIQCNKPLSSTCCEQGLTAMLTGGGGGVYSYIRIQTDEFLFKSNSN